VKLPVTVHQPNKHYTSVARLCTFSLAFISVATTTDNAVHLCWVSSRA